MRTLQAMIVTGEDRKAPVFLRGALLVGSEQLAGLLFMQLEKFSRDGSVGVLKIVGGKLLLFEEPYLRIAAIVRPANVVDAVHALEVGTDTVQAISQFHRDRIEVNSAALLEVGELCNFEAIQKDLPANSPSA